MGGDWFDTTIGDQVELQRGFDITRVEQRAEDVPVVSSGGPSSFHDTALVKGPGVVLGRKGVVGSVFYIDRPFWPHDTTLFVKDFKGNDPRFVFYFFRAIAPLLASLDVGSANPTLNRNHVHPQPVRWPVTTHQVPIGELLGVLDDKIQQNRRMTETLEAMARALFKSWFVDFDPVHAKEEGRSTNLPHDLAAMFPDKFSEDGRPEGWSSGSLRDLATLNPENWTRSNIPEVIEYVDLANAKWGAIEAVQVLDKSDAPSRAQRVLRTGDTIVGIVRPGNGSFAHISRDGLTGSTGFAVLRSKYPRRDAIVYFAVTAQENIEALANLADGAAYPAVRPEDVIDTPFIRPKPAVLDAFEAAVAPMLASVHARADQSRTLADLRDMLLPKLISGELQIADAEKRVAAA